MVVSSSSRCLHLRIGTRSRRRPDNCVLVDPAAPDRILLRRRLPSLRVILPTMSSMGPPPPDGDVNYGPGNVETIAVLCTISIVVVAMRFATRIWITKSLWWDDWTILLALLGTVIGSALDFVEVHYGFGRHQYYLTAYQLQEFQKYTYGEWIQTFATLMWLKVSICLFLLRIPTSKALIRPLQGAIAFLILSNVILTLLWILQCLPVAASWNMKISGKCFTKDQLREIILAQASEKFQFARYWSELRANRLEVISLISDFTFSCYPILILWRVQLKPKTKIGLCILMGLGVMYVTSAIVVHRQLLTCGFRTGSCCIVRTVLNYESIPPDVTCKFNTETIDSPANHYIPS